LKTGNYLLLARGQSMFQDHAPDFTAQVPTRDELGKDQADVSSYMICVSRAIRVAQRCRSLPRCHVWSDGVDTQRSQVLGWL